jgi:hypothetical protein
MQARTKYPNTPESDQHPTVPHIVTLDDGREVEVEATDPSQAILLVQLKQDGYLGEFCSGDEHCACGGGWFQGAHITHAMLSKINL